jgi:hypothetical protein
MNQLTEGSTSPKLTLEQVSDTLQQLAANVNANHYRIGHLYNYVVANKLAELSGFESAQAFFQQRVKVLSQTVLSLCGTVARAFSEAACSRYGVYHLHALLAYAKAAKLQVSAEEPGPTPIKVPKANGTVELKPFAECTVEELRLAVKHLRAKDTPRLPEDTLARIQALRDSIVEHFPESTSRTRVSARTHQDKTYITLRDVLVEDIELLAEALLDSLEPMPAAA